MWSFVISLGGTFRGHQELLVNTASEVRARLKRAMTYSSDMFATNMQCLAHILSLKKDYATLQVASNSAIQVMPAENFAMYVMWNY